MKLMYVKIAILILIVGLLSACGSQATGTPVSASQPTEQVLPATSAPTTETPATQPAAQSAAISFAHDVLPIMESRCVSCHGENRIEKGLDLKTYDSLMAGSQNGLVVSPGDAVDSKLVELIVNQKMPKRGPKLTAPQIDLITQWVNQGALNN
ncbi:MAG TPA: c-type cytochrome domain-containing protein [Anaerolineales bacterium]|nr:c-type cytochrome domain-containing protein [Anaerolineales bacterium]